LFSLVNPTAANCLFALALTSESNRGPKDLRERVSPDQQHPHLPLRPPPMRVFPDERNLFSTASSPRDQPPQREMIVARTVNERQDRTSQWTSP